MKKIKTTILILLFILLLTSCSNNKDTSNNEIQKQNINKTIEYTEDITKEWIADNEWKLNIDKIYPTEERNHYINKKDNQEQYTDKTPVEVLKIQYTYENLNPEFNNLLIIPYKIITNNNEVAYNYPLYEINHPSEIDKNEVCENAEVAFGFDKKTENVKIYFKQKDSNSNFKEIVYEYDFN